MGPQAHFSEQVKNGESSVATALGGGSGRSLARRAAASQTRAGKKQTDKEEAMGGELEQELRDYFVALDRMELEPLLERLTDDMQGIDELSRGWTRGKNEFAAKIAVLTENVSDVNTKITDVVEHVWGDTGVVTCWMEQDYTYDGATQHVSAPTTVVFRRPYGTWKMAVFHMIPVPD
jgi:ketosteroid isomerase-like protein